MLDVVFGKIIIRSSINNETIRLLYNDQLKLNTHTNYCACKCTHITTVYIIN